MTITSNISKSDTLSTSRDGTSGVADRIEQIGQAIASMVRRVHARRTEARLRKETLRELNRLNDHMLRDIGLSRDNLPGATSGRIAGWRSLELWRD